MLYLSHLLLSLSFGRLGVGVVVSLDQNEVVGLRVDDKLSGGVLQREGHLVEDGPQLLQGQDSARQIRGRENEEDVLTRQSQVLSVSCPGLCFL